MDKQNNSSLVSPILLWKSIILAVLIISSICISALFVDSMEYTIFAGSLAGIIASPIVYILGIICLFIVALFQGGSGVNTIGRDFGVFLLFVFIMMLICIIYFGIPFVKNKLIIYKKEKDYKTKKKMAFMIGVYYGIIIFTMSIVTLCPFVFFYSKLN